MRQQTGTRALTARSSAVTEDRRASPRCSATVPVALHGESGVLEGYTINLGAHGALIHSGRLPAVEEAADLAMLLPGGRVVARVRITRVELQQGRFAVEFLHMFQNGHLVLEYLDAARAAGRLD